MSQNAEGEADEVRGGCGARYHGRVKLQLGADLLQGTGWRVGSTKFACNS